MTFWPSWAQASRLPTSASSRAGSDPLYLLNSTWTAGSIISSASLRRAATLDYDPVRGANETPSVLCSGDPSYQKDVKALVVELRHLNSLLEPKRPGKKAERAVTDLNQHLNTFLKNYAAWRPGRNFLAAHSKLFGAKSCKPWLATEAHGRAVRTAGGAPTGGFRISEERRLGLSISPVPHLQHALPTPVACPPTVGRSTNNGPDPSPYTGSRLAHHFLGPTGWRSVFDIIRWRRLHCEPRGPGNSP